MCLSKTKKSWFGGFFIGAYPGVKFKIAFKSCNKQICARKSRKTRKNTLVVFFCSKFVTLEIGCTKETFPSLLCATTCMLVHIYQRNPLKEIFIFLCGGSHLGTNFLQYLKNIPLGDENRTFTD